MRSADSCSHGRLLPSAPPLEYVDNIYLCAAAPLMRVTLPPIGATQLDNCSREVMDSERKNMATSKEKPLTKKTFCVKDILELRKFKKLVEKMSRYKRRVKFSSSVGCAVTIAVVLLCIL